MVEDAYKNYPFKTLRQIWLTVQSFMNKMIEEKGDNTFKIAHMNMDALEVTNQLSLFLVVTPGAKNYPLNALAE
jgi:hypothetical protein